MRKSLIKVADGANGQERSCCCGPGYRSKGFTLMEVLVALCILSVICVILGPLLSTGLVWIDGAGQESRAAFLAFSLLEAVRANPPQVKGFLQLEAEELGVKIEEGWEAKVYLLPCDDLNRLLKVRAEVKYDSVSKEKVVIHTMIRQK
ncbi:type IV pilus modification PilV family protein [Syntrophomonas erecta]